MLNFKKLNFKVDFAKNDTFYKETLKDFKNVILNLISTIRGYMVDYVDHRF